MPSAMRIISATCAILAAAVLPAASSEVAEHWDHPFHQHTLYPYSGHQAGYDHYQHLMPTLLIPIKEDDRHHPFTSATWGRVYFSGSKSTKDEERMLVSFRVPSDEPIEKTCFLGFSYRLGYARGAEEGGDVVEARIRGHGWMHAYKLREEIFVGKTTYHGRPRRESEKMVFGMSVPLEGGFANVSGRGFPCAPGETVTFEIAPATGIGMVDVCWNQEAMGGDDHIVESGIGLRVISPERFEPEND